MNVFTVYRNPLDYPGKIVVRRSVITGGDIVPDAEPCVVTDADQYDAVADWMAEMTGLCFLSSCPGDDPAIAGVWL